MSAEMIITLALGLVVVWPVAAAAQKKEDAGLQTGDRIRLTAPSMGLAKLEGTLEAIDTERRILSIEADDTRIAVPIDALTVLQMAREERSGVPGLFIGALLGAAVGAGIGSAVGETCPDSVGLEGLAPCFDRGSTATIGAVLGGALGAGIGYRVSRGPRWEAVPIQKLAFRVSPVRTGGPAVMASIRF